MTFQEQNKNFLLMWLQYHNSFYCSLRFCFTSSFAFGFQFEAFPFLAGRLQNIQSIKLEGFEIERKFILVSPEEFEKLDNFRKFLNIREYPN